MELKNIHTRKEFVKTNEAGPFLSGSEGGVGANDGFANNAKLKDTYLGKLLNGLFSGIGWLWRKSKEYFVINKLIAQLVNELLRGIILFCFANNISLKDGSKSTSTNSKEGEAEENNKEGEAEETDKEGEAEEIEEEPETMSREELIEEIKKLGKILNEDNTELSTEKSRIRMAEAELDRITNQKDKATKQASIDKQKIRYADIERSIKENEIEIEKLKERLKKLPGQQQQKPGVSIFSKLDKSCRDQQFNEFSENPSPIASTNQIEPVSYQEFINKFKKINLNEVKIGDDFRAVINNTFEDIKVIGIDKDDIKYKIKKNNTTGQIHVSKLLPSLFPNFSIKNKLVEFLKKYINSYNDGTMPEENKKKMELFYTNYIMINAMSNYSRSTKINESNINEESLVRNIGKNIAHSSGSVKVKPDEPKAGQVGLGKAIAMKAGASANVGNILTKRDRDKYKDKESEFSINVHDINLAEIEKTVEKMDDDSPENENVKAKVSSYVNPYNLKTIQISAEQLIGAAKTTEGTDNALRLRWNKEVTNTYAAFTNIMDIEKVNIINEYGKNLNDGKIKKSVDNKVSETKAQNALGQIQNGLPLEEGTVNFTGMKDGLWCYYSFLYSMKGFNTSIAPVADAFNDNVGLFQITSVFDSVDDATKTIVPNKDFYNIFSTTSSDSNTNPSKIKVFFLIKSGKNFPSSNNTKGILNNVFVLNEFVYSDGTSKLFIKKTGGKNILIDKNLIVNNFDSSIYLHNTKTMFCAKFSKSNFEPWKKAFNFSDKNNFLFHHSPKFLDTEMLNILKQLDKFIK